MKRIAFATVFIALAPVLFAETIRFDPPNPSASRSVDATFTGIWPNGCVPSVKSVVVNGATILLHLNATPPLGVLCTQLVSPYSRLFHLGVLPARVYTVIVVADQGSTSSILVQAPLIVRDAETLSITPYAVPVSGGQIVIKNPYFLAASIVTIGGVQVPANSDVDGLLIINAPPHAAGAVDVLIFPSGCGDPCPPPTAAPAGLIYYDPAAADPAVFEPILFPLSFQGPGALGSQWTTESFLLGSTSTAYFRDALPCDGCSSSLGPVTKLLTNDSSPWGHVLYAMRGTTDGIDFTSRVRDTSRQALTAGTEVPVVRERDFRALLRFANIPADKRYRVMLRLWSLGDNSQFVAAFDSVEPAAVFMTRIPGTTISFGSIDITPLLSNASTNPTFGAVYPAGLPFQPPPIWGMLSITNNDTQQVTIISPQ